MRDLLKVIITTPAEGKSSRQTVFMAQDPQMCRNDEENHIKVFLQFVTRLSLYRSVLYTLRLGTLKHGRKTTREVKSSLLTPPLLSVITPGTTAQPDLPITLKSIHHRVTLQSFQYAVYTDAPYLPLHP